MNKKSTTSRSVAKPYPRRCAECGKVAVAATTISYNAEVKHDGKLHKFHIPKLKIDKCQSCGEEFFTNSTDEQISASLRSVIGLLHPEEIRHQLGLLGISQRTLAEHLRIAQETVSRWMTGLAIQNRALDTLMRVYFEYPDVRKTLAKPGPLKSLGLGDQHVTDCEGENFPHEAIVRSASCFVATSETSVSTARCFRRQFSANVLARRPLFQLVPAELNLN